MSREGHVELDWAVDAIRVGDRARQDVGDLTELVESIRMNGLLQPITVSPDGVLLCGARRLAAVKQLGHRVVNVWVRAGVSTRLERLIAEQDENLVRKALLPTEASALYRELRQIFAEDAAHRAQAARFGARGDAKLAAPAAGPSRVRAARMVTGGASYTTLERVGQVQKIAGDPSVPEDVRRVAAAALNQMDADRKVDGHYRRVRAAVDDARSRELSDLAQAAIARATVAGGGEPGRYAQGGPTRSGGRLPRQLGVRAFLLTWDELSGWVDRYDAASIGRELTDAQWASFAATVHDTVEFLARAQRAREVVA